MPAGWRDLGWGSDAALLVWAPAMNALFDLGARAVVGFSTEGSGDAAIREGPSVHLQSPDAMDLFIDWLNEVNYRLQVDRWIVRNPMISLITDQALHARLDGLPMSGSMRFLHEIKAVTRHSSFLRRANNGIWVARVILDL